MIVYLLTVTDECCKHRWRAAHNMNSVCVCVWRVEGVGVERVWSVCRCVCMEGGIKDGGGVRGNVYVCGGWRVCVWSGMECV